MPSRAEGRRPSRRGRGRVLGLKTQEELTKGAVEGLRNYEFAARLRMPAWAASPSGWPTNGCRGKSEESTLW